VGITITAFHRHQMIVLISNPLARSCSIHPRRQYGNVPYRFPRWTTRKG